MFADEFGASVPELMLTEGLGVSMAGPAPPDELGAPALELVLTEGLGVSVSGTTPPEEVGASALKLVLTEALGVLMEGAVSPEELGMSVAATVVVGSMPEPDSSGFVHARQGVVGQHFAGQMVRSRRGLRCLCVPGMWVDGQTTQQSGGHGTIAIAATLQRPGGGLSTLSQASKPSSPELFTDHDADAYTLRSYDGIHADV